MTQNLKAQKNSKKLVIKIKLIIIADTENARRDRT